MVKSRRTEVVQPVGDLALDELRREADQLAERPLVTDPGHSASIPGRQRPAGGQVADTCKSRALGYQAEHLLVEPAPL